MTETASITAKELVEKAKKSIGRSDEPALEVLAIAAGVVEAVDELKAIRVALEKLEASKSVSTPAPVRETLGALARDLPPGVSRVTPCRSCAAPMYWVKTSSGKKMPLDAVPLEGVAARDGFGIRDGVASKAYDGPKFSSHFSTCPNADEHRKPRT